MACSSSVSLTSTSQDTVTDTGAFSHLPNPIHVTDYRLLYREEKHRIIVLGPRQPQCVNYPATEHERKRRSFQAKWFNLSHARDWLEYSRKADVMFCFACRLFGSQCHVNQQCWMSNGVRGGNWKNATRAI